MKVLGIDPGFGRVGYAFVEQRHGVFATSGYGLIETDKNRPLPARLQQIHDAVTRLTRENAPDCIATEAILFAANRTTAIDVSKALGVVLLAASEASLPWTEYTPSQVKLTVTGSGSADKKQVQYMVTRLLNLRETPKPDDVADAIAIAICHSLCARQPVS
jgi:crossover junction endodeoxyribonuclease RuvC